MPPKNSERSSKFPEGHKVIHRTAQRAFFRVVTPRTFHPFCRVWKGIFGIRDLTKIRCGNRENDKYIDGIRDLTVSREAGLAENWARDAGFMFRVRRECWKPLKTRVNSKYQSKGSTYILHLLAFVEIRLFNVFF